MRVLPYRPSFYLNDFIFENVDVYINETYNLEQYTNFIIYDNGYIKLKGIPEKRRPPDVIYPKAKSIYNGAKTLAAWYTIYKRYKDSYREFLSSKLDKTIASLAVEKPDIWVFNNGLFDLSNRIARRLREEYIDFFPKYFWNTYHETLDKLLKYQTEEFYDHIVNFSSLSSIIDLFSADFKRNVLYFNLSVLKHDSRGLKDQKSVFVLDTKKGEVLFPEYSNIVSKQTYSLVDTKRRFSDLKTKAEYSAIN